MDQKTLQEITLIDRTGTNSTKWGRLAIIKFRKLIIRAF